MKRELMLVAMVVGIVASGCKERESATATPATKPTTVVTGTNPAASMLPQLEKLAAAAVEKIKKEDEESDKLLPGYNHNRTVTAIRTDVENSASVVDPVVGILRVKNIDTVTSTPPRYFKVESVITTLTVAPRDNGWKCVKAERAFDGKTVDCTDEWRPFVEAAKR